MKYLILTASTGQGHNQAANNLKIEIEKNNSSALILDLFTNNLKFNFTKNTIEKGYDILASKIPDAYGLLYNVSNNKFLNPILLKNIFIYSELTIIKTIKKYKPDIIISTHPFAVPIISRIKEIFKINIPFIQVVTDFKAHYTYVDKNVQAYIVASDYTKNSLIEKGVSDEKIHVFGIPIKEEFLNTEKIKKDNFKILIMGGSMGLKDMEKSVEILLNSNLDIKIIVVCGKNISLYKKLNKKFINKIIEGKAKILGYTNKISQFMDECKLIITKPGGLTTSEAINKKLPMIIPFTIPGQEQENANFLTEENVAIEINDIEILPKYIKNLIDNKEIYQNMVNNMEKLSKCYRTENIIKLAENLIINK